MSEHVQIKGLKKVVRDLKVLNAEAVVAVREANLEAARLVESEAKARAPRVSGRLAGTIRAGATKTGASVRVGSKAVPYAAPIHWGWPKHNIAPQPFLYDALDSRRAEIVEIYAKRIDEITKRPGRP